MKIKCGGQWLLMFLLGGCSGSHTGVFSHVEAKAEVIGANKQVRCAALRQLVNTPVQVVQVGAQLKVILSTDDLFYSKSARLRVSSYPLLDKVVALLNTYDKEVMRIAAYTDDKGEFKRDQALSQMRARYLSNYMWQHGLDTRLLQMDASGQAGAIASNRSIHGRSQNRRVEITIWEILPLT